MPSSLTYSRSSPEQGVLTRVLVTIRTSSISSHDVSYRIEFRFNDFKCAMLPACGKLLRYIPGATSPKLLIGPEEGEGGPLSSAPSLSFRLICGTGFCDTR